MEWINLGGQLVSSIVGGLIAYLIARYQMKKSQEQAEKEQDQAKERERIELEEAQKRIITFVEESAKRTRNMEMVRIQVEECRESISILINLVNYLSNVSRLTSDIVHGLGEEDYLDALGKRAELVLNISSQLTKLISSTKICDFNEENIKECEQLKVITYSLLNELETNVNSSEVAKFDNITKKVDYLYSKFISRQEELILILSK